MFGKKYNEFLKLMVYQVYPRSFKDTNGDGIGDLRGIIEKLDYLNELGINAIWICPCFKSPQVDNGYDISDYCDIQPELGNMADIKELIEKAHSRGIKILMDLVANHTSSEHKWFKESKKSKDNPYSDYYYWYDEPQATYGSIWGGSAWEFCEERQQYYLHRYHTTMPDLNWTNPKVRQEMYDVVDFWSGLGVDGFRCDVITEISKDFSKNQMGMGPHIHEYINGLFGRKEAEHLFTVGECWVWSKEEFCKLTKEARKELSTMFQFEHILFGKKKGGYIPNPQSLTGLRDILIRWQEISYENDLLYPLFTDNHDQPCFISRVGDCENKRYELATCVATMFYTLRGIPFIFQGQEFGRISPHYDSIDDFRDVSALNYYKYNVDELGEDTVLEHLNFGSRDNARRPVSWDDSEYNGFSDVAPWITLHSNYKDINLKKDRESKKSVFEFYKAILKLRKENDEIIYGDLKVLSQPENEYWLFERELDGKKIVVCCNFENESKIKIPYDNAKLLLSNNIDRKDASEEYSTYEVAIYRV